MTETKKILNNAKGSSEIEKVQVYGMIHSFNYTEKWFFFYQLCFETQESDVQAYGKLQALACSVGHFQGLIYLVMLLLKVISYIRKG